MLKKPWERSQGFCLQSSIRVIPARKGIQQQNKQNHKFCAVDQAEDHRIVHFINLQSCKKEKPDSGDQSDTGKDHQGIKEGIAELPEEAFETPFVPAKP